jgi:hypothetical protein
MSVGPHYTCIPQSPTNTCTIEPGGISPVGVYGSILTGQIMSIPTGTFSQIPGGFLPSSDQGLMMPQHASHNTCVSGFPSQAPGGTQPFAAQGLVLTPSATMLQSITLPSSVIGSMQTGQTMYTGTCSQMLGGSLPLSNQGVVMTQYAPNCNSGCDVPVRASVGTQPLAAQGLVRSISSVPSDQAYQLQTTSLPRTHTQTVQYPPIPHIAQQEYTSSMPSQISVLQHGV